MKPQYILPILLILIDIGAAVVYASGGDLKKMTYWLAAAVLNACVTF